MKWIRCALIVLLPGLALAQGTAPGAGAASPSVLVTTQTPRQGSLPRIVVGYGTMQTTPGGSETLSLLRAGQVQQLDVHQGEAVKQGQALLVVSADPAALAAYKQAVAAVTLAQTQRAHAAQLLAQRLGTRDQLAAADKALTDAQAALDALNRAGGGAARQALTAPFDGIVSSVLVAPGTRVAAQAPLVTLARSSKLLAAIGIEPGRRHLLAVGQPARLEPLYDGQAGSGRVVSIGAMLDPVTRLVTVLIEPSPGTSPISLALSGSPVRAAIQVGAMRGWTVPRNAVQADAKGAHVFQVAAGKAARVDVRVVGMVGAETVVAGPLDPARALVIAGSYQLQDGMAVRMDSGPPAGAATAAATP